MDAKCETVTDTPFTVAGSHGTNDRPDVHFVQLKYKLSVFARITDSTTQGDAKLLCTTPARLHLQGFIETISEFHCYSK